MIERPSAAVRIACVAAFVLLCALVTYIPYRLHLSLERPHFSQRFLARWHGFTYLDDKDVVFQKGRIDCGPAALRMLLLRLGHDVPLARLESETLDSRDGTSVGRMLGVLREHGVACQAKQLSRAAWNDASPPYIALYRRDHFVVVSSRRGSRYLILDPSLGRGEISAVSLFHNTEGILILPAPPD